MTPGERAYAEYFDTRRGLSSEGTPLPKWGELPDDIRTWWNTAAVRPPGSPPLWKNPIVWLNAIVLMLAAAEAHMELLSGLLPGHIFAWVAIGLPLVNGAIRGVRLILAQRSQLGAGGAVMRPTAMPCLGCMDPWCKDCDVHWPGGRPRGPQ